MKIAGTGGPRANAARRSDKSTASGDGAFAKHVSNAATPNAGAVAGSTQLSSVEALLAVQGTGDALDGGQAAGVARAEDLLDRLEDIRVGLLLGRFSRGRLENLVARLAQSRADGADERLGALLDEIELRAKVELAKLAMI